MLKKIIIFHTVLIVLFSISYSIRNQHPDTKKSVIAIRLSDYHSYLKSNPSLDRFFIKDNLGYFLVSENEIQRIERSGLEIIFQKVLPPSPPAVSRFQTTGDYNGRFHNYQETETMLLELENLSRQHIRLSSRPSLVSP